MMIKLKKRIVTFIILVVTIVSAVDISFAEVGAKTKRCTEAELEVGDSDYTDNITNGLVNHLSTGKTANIVMCKGLTSAYYVKDDVHEVDEQFPGVGDLFRVRVRGEAHKITATSSRSSIVSVSVKNTGEIYLTAKKCGSAVITIRSSCGNKFKLKIKVKEHTYNTVETKDNNVKYRYCTCCGTYIADVSSVVTMASDDLAQQIHETIFAKKSITFYTKGKPDKICNELKEKIKSINNQGVVFKYNSEKILGSDNCYKVVISKNQAEGYYYAIKLAEKILERYKAIFENECMITLENWNRTYEGEYGEGEEPEICTFDEVYTWRYSNLDDVQKRMLDATGMNELSDMLKLYVISESGYFDCGEDDVGISYVSSWAGNFRDLSEGKRLNEILNSTAKGVCEDYARGEITFFSYLGIEVKYVSRRPAGTAGHAWTEGVVADSQGKKYEYRFDYHLCIEMENDSLVSYDELKEILN